MKLPHGGFFPLAFAALVCTACSRGVDGGEGEARGGLAATRSNPSRDGKVASVRLDIPPREQWPNDHGYCGEASVQSIGLYYGAWISQRVVRNVAGGELILGVNDGTALRALNFEFESWHKRIEPLPQNESFMLWMKKNIVHGIPCIFTVYLEGMTDEDYDHIMPAIGIVSADSTGTTFDPSDRLVFSSNFDPQALQRPFDTLRASRRGCRAGMDTGGCVPDDRDYGLAVQGITDVDGATLPVRLSVGPWNEPNTSLGEDEVEMFGTVTVSELTVGRKYALLRYDDDPSRVPTRGRPADFLQSAFASKKEFTAAATQWTYRDPNAFWSGRSAYYRCVPLP